MITSQYAETTRIDWQGLMQTKFHGEISNGTRIKFRVSLKRPGFLVIKIRIKTREDAVIQIQIIIVLHDLIQTRASDLAQDFNWVMTQAFPHFVIKFAEEMPGFRLPCPPQVISTFAKPLDALGQIEKFRKSRFECSHSGQSYQTFRIRYLGF